MSGQPAVETKSELVQVSLKMRGFDRAVVSSSHPNANYRVEFLRFPENHHPMRYSRRGAEGGA